MTERRLTLLVDADDTLWENAVHFRRARTWWHDSMRRRGVEPERATRIFETLESLSFAHGWFGSNRLEHNMLEAARRLVGELAPSFRDEIIGWADAVRNHEIRLYQGVDTTLRQLERRHDLMVVTMGDHREQAAKVERSGLASHFRHVEVMRDKTVASYRRLIDERAIRDGFGWMIGNSLAKDVEPARQAGLGTVHLDNGTSFPPGPGEPDVVIREFSELLDHF